MKFASFLLLALICSTLSRADTFERVEVVGANGDGSRIAIIRSYFGPSSYAPFVRLQVVEGQSQVPVFEKGYSSLQGDEAAVTEMRKKLLIENDVSLKDLGIGRQFSLTPVDAFATAFDNQLLVEADVYQSGDIARYNIFLSESEASSCSGSTRKPLALRMCSLYENTAAQCTLIEPYGTDGLGCFAGDVTFSRMVRIGSFFWFHLFVRTEPLEGLYFYSHVLQGERAR